MFSNLRRSRTTLVLLTLLAMAAAEANAVTAEAGATNKASANSDSIQKKKKAVTKRTDARSPATQAPQSAAPPARAQGGYRPDYDPTTGY